MGKKRVIIDARMVGGVGHGIGNYVLDLAASLKERALPFELFFLVAKGSNSPLRSYPHRESSLRFLHPLEPWLLARELEGADLFHSPSFMSLASYPCPHVQTVHDLNHLRFGSLPQKIYYRRLLLPSLRSARALLSVSRGAAEEIRGWLRGFGVEKEIELAPNAIAAPAAPEKKILERMGLKEYFFCLSNPKPHKNLEMLARAHYNARSRGDCLPLALSAKGEFQEGVVWLGALAPGEITALFEGARALLFPSLYEGFGRPPLEAALAGCPPVVSDIPVHREALSGVKEAEFLSPTDPRAWEEKMLALSQAPRKPVSEESRGWIRRTYSLARLGDKMEAIYRAALSP
jgi:glycosyltransferase involved in cell wall biosynthesis